MGCPNANGGHLSHKIYGEYWCVQVREELANDVMTSVCAGLNAAVIAMGATSTGKSYTMGTSAPHSTSLPVSTFDHPPSLLLLSTTHVIL